jgi:hypothetical protein
MRAFFVVLARNSSLVEEKIRELNDLGFPYVVVCGEKMRRPEVIFREPRGKYDAINFALSSIPPNTEVIAFNDVDTKIANLDSAFDAIKEGASLVFVRVNVEKGPQRSFYSNLDALRKMIPIAASGELMLIRYELLKRITPLEKCKAEDSLLLFKTLQLGGRAVFCEQCYVTTVRTMLPSEEEDYKRRTTAGIYQALSMTRPPPLVILFYRILPLLAPLLLIRGKKGYYWTKGILLGFLDFIRGDKSGTWIAVGGKN